MNERALLEPGRSVVPVPVSGMGCICAAGANLAECMAPMFRGERAPRPPTLFDTDHSIDYPVFELAPAPLPGDEGQLPRTSRIALLAAEGALASARFTTRQLQHRRVGVCIGTTVGSTLNSEEFYRQYHEGEETDMAPIRRFLGSNPARVLARKYELDAPCQTVVNACSSGTDAIGIAADWIRAGVCEIAIAGGTDELSRVTYNGFISLMVHDSKPCRPFDAARGGLNLGEGAGLLVLESTQSCQARGVRPCGHVLGYATASDAHHLTAPHPDGLGLRRALSEALARSQVVPEDIAFVNAHGTGTRDNDQVEGNVLADLLPNVPFLSTKGYTGHTLGAAGGIEAVLTLQCLLEGRAPGNAGCTEPDPDCGAAPIPAATRVEGRIAISQSLAFGGNNGVLVLARGET